MTYIIAEPCIDIKDRSCIDVCPVDCIHEFERLLVIDPEECIDWIAATHARVISERFSGFICRAFLRERFVGQLICVGRPAGQLVI
jgi:hypothetical protein